MAGHWLKISQLLPGTAKEALAKAVGGTAVSGDVGVLLLGTRDDALSTLAESEGQFSGLRLDSEGRLWVRTDVELRQTMILSHSTDGQPIAIGTGSTSVHTPPSGSATFDQVFLWITNTTTTQKTVTIEFGGTGGGQQINLLVPNKETVMALAGPPIRSALPVTAKADNTGCNAFGYVERVTV